jgi:hypothetical protein
MKMNWIREEELKILAKMQNKSLEKFLEENSHVYALWENSPYAEKGNKIYKVMYENFDKVHEYLNK